MNRRIVIAISIVLLSIIAFAAIKTNTKQYSGNNNMNNAYSSYGNLSEIKVTSIYESVSDGMEGRSIDAVSNIFKDTKTDFVFMGWFRWYPSPESPRTVLPPEYPPNYVKESADRGYTYEHLRNAITKIKENNENIIFGGAVPAQILTPLTWNEITGEQFGREETWGMALNPKKWNIDYSKEKAQCEFAKTHFWVNPDMDCKDYVYTEAGSYYPDITNSDFQKLFLSWAEKQIDAGADAIWIDMLFKQASLLREITKDPNHPGVKESFEASSKLVDKIHEYGASKGKYVYVGSWPDSVMYPYPQPNLDFVTMTSSSNEVYSLEMDEKKWDDRIKEIRKVLGNITIFSILDWAADVQPTAVFSQKLTPENQRKFLKVADEFLQKKGVIFVYPIHGGYMGNNAKILSFGKYKKYDAFAPEFDTFDTIKELAGKKAASK